LSINDTHSHIPKNQNIPTTTTVTLFLHKLKTQITEHVSHKKKRHNTNNNKKEKKRKWRGFELWS